MLHIFSQKKKKMAKIVGAFICLVIVAMDVMAGILGIEAEIEQNKVCHLFPKQKTLYFYFSLFMF